VLLRSMNMHGSARTDNAVLGAVQNCTKWNNGLLPMSSLTVSIVSTPRGEKLSHGGQLLMLICNLCLLTECVHGRSSWQGLLFDFG